MTEWPARLDGDVWRCGHLAEGRYCHGIVAHTTTMPDGQRVTMYLNGYVQGPLGWYLPSARSQRKGRLRLRRPRSDSPVGPPRRDNVVPLIETRTRCLRCGDHCVAVVPGIA